MRHLRTYEHMAQKMYPCDECGKEPIFPGDIYVGEVFVTKDHRILIRRNHIVPACSDIPDPDEIMRIFEEMDRQTERDGFKENANKSLEKVA